MVQEEPLGKPGLVQYQPAARSGPAAGASESSSYPLEEQQQQQQQEEAIIPPAAATKTHPPTHLTLIQQPLEEEEEADTGKVPLTAAPATPVDRASNAAFVPGT